MTIAPHHSTAEGPSTSLYGGRDVGVNAASVTVGSTVILREPQERGVFDFFTEILLPDTVEQAPN
ncbi:MAG: hypothetical protein HQ477_02855 [Chloroflexi bacterium]|nr:hypothetical protein [Chloroflexota bacterium]